MRSLKSGFINSTTFLAALFLALFFSFDAAAQSNAGTYQKVTYYQVDKDNLDQFLDDVATWKDQHRSAMQRTDRTGWRLYRVVMSSSAGAWYNFVTIEQAANLNALQERSRSSAESLKRDRDKRIKLSFAVHSEIWFTEAEVSENGSTPSRYLNANFMYAVPHALADYLELEIDIAAPLHQHQADNNRMDGWNFNRLVFPTGTTVAYNFVTTDFYSSLEQIEMGITREVIMNVHPGMNVDEFEDFADSIRERVWSDLWELIEFVD
jgi:hypothetical protein